MAKEIDIAEPIWKTRSVGLAIDDVPMGQEVKVTISYRKKATGELAYPGEYFMNVDEIRKYPTQRLRGVRVHIVPISDLAIKTVINKTQNKTPMLFDQSSLKKIIDESEKQKAENGGSNKKLLEPGKHIMSLVDVQLVKAKDSNPMIVCEFSKDDEHRTIKEFFKIAGPNTDIPREKLVKTFHRGFGYAIQPCNTETDLINQLVKFKGKELTVAVKGAKKAYAFKDKTGNDVVMETTMPEFWYCATKGEFDEFYVDMEKAISPLSEEDMNKLIAFAEINGGPYVPQSKTEKTEKVTPQPAKQEPTPTKAPVQPKPIENVAAAAAAETAPEPQPVPPAEESAPEAQNPPQGGDDDFPF